MSSRSTTLVTAPSDPGVETVYVPTVNAGKRKPPWSSVVAWRVRLLPVSVTAAFGTGFPSEVTVPLIWVETWARTFAVVPATSASMRSMAHRRTPKKCRNDTVIPSHKKLQQKPRHASRQGGKV